MDEPDVHINLNNRLAVPSMANDSPRKHNENDFTPKFSLGVRRSATTNQPQMSDRVIKSSMKNGAEFDRKSYNPSKTIRFAE